jgi:hypothetical protein
VFGCGLVSEDFVSHRHICDAGRVTGAQLIEAMWVRGFRRDFPCLRKTNKRKRVTIVTLFVYRERGFKNGDIKVYRETVSGASLRRAIRWVLLCAVNMLEITFYYAGMRTAFRALSPLISLTSSSS